MFSDAAVRHDLTARLGDTVHLPCVTPSDSSVEWMHYRHPVYVNRQIRDGFRSKYSVVDDGQHTLMIQNVTAAEAGEYTCIDEDGHGPNIITYHLTVTGNYSSQGIVMPRPTLGGHSCPSLCLSVTCLRLSRNRKDLENFT